MVKVVRLNYSDPDHGTIVEWFGSHRAAETRKKEIEAEDQYVYSLKGEDIPLNKKELVQWLNTNLNRDNG